MSEIENSFRTKTGTCTITENQIILTREGLRGGLAKVMFGVSVDRVLIMYVLIGIILLVSAFMSFVGGSNGMGVFTSVVGVIFLWNAITARNNSASPVIERSTIQSVEAHLPRPPFTRGYFAVQFDDNGKLKKRLIILPGSMQGGSEEFNRAKDLLMQVGLLK